MLAALVIALVVFLFQIGGNMTNQPFHQPAEKMVRYIGDVTIQNRTNIPNYFGTQFTFHFVVECPPDVSGEGLREHGVYGCGGWETPYIVYPYPSNSNVFLVTNITLNVLSIECNHEIYHLLSNQTVDQDHEFLKTTLNTPLYPDYYVCKSLIQMFQNGTLEGLV